MKLVHLRSTAGIGLSLFIAFIALAGCNGGYGTQSESGSEAGYAAATPGQQLLLDQTQKRNAKEVMTQAPDFPAPTSAASSKCEGFPGFDRGCPGGGK